MSFCSDTSPGSSRHVAALFWTPGTPDWTTSPGRGISDRRRPLCVLGEAGYQVIEAPDGSSGLSLLRSDRRIDLLISDVGLPGGLNGRQVADAPRETRPDLKVLFTTGYAENAAVGNGLLVPGMEVMTKPFAMAELALRCTT